MRILMIVTAGFFIGLLAALLYLSLTAALIFSGILLIFGLVLIFLRNKKLLGPILVLYGMAAGIFWTVGYNSLVVDPVAALAGQKVCVTAEISGYSEVTDYGTRASVLLPLSDRKMKSVLYFDSYRELKPGDTVTAEVTLAIPQGDGYYYQYSSGIYLVAYENRNSDTNVVPCDKVPLRYLPKRIARALEDSLREAFPEDVLGLILALVTGNRSELSDGEIYDLKVAGCYHALALSGQHLAVLVSICAALIRNKRRRALVVLPLCLVFVVITGMSPSLVRANIMLWFVQLAPFMRRDSDSLTALSAAGLLLMLENPWCATSAGVQLSFAACLGIILFGTKIEVYFTNKFHVNNKKSPGYFIITSTAITFSALTLTLPLQMVYFNMVSLVSPLANLLTGFVVDACFGSGLLCAVLGVFLPAVAAGFGWVLAWPLRYIHIVMAFFADIPFAALYANQTYCLLWMVLLYAVILLLVFRSKTGKLIPACCVLSGLSVMLLLTMLDAGRFSVTALDVGQGQCIVFHSGGSTLMMDCGGRYSGEIAADHLTAHGENAVDILIVTHFDADHIGGIEALLERKKVRKMIVPDMEDEAGDNLIVLAKRFGTEVILCQSDLEVTFGNGNATVYAPLISGARNESGLSALVTGGALSTLVTGDMQSGTELLLLREKKLPDIDIFVAGHHGAEESTSTLLLETTKPEAVLISVGENIYGHPHEETLSRINASGAECYRTDQSGTITIKEGSPWQKRIK